jgi:hypothetical protein
LTQGIAAHACVLLQAKLLGQYIDIINPLIDELRQRLAASQGRGTGPGQASSASVSAAIDRVGTALQVRRPAPDAPAGPKQARQRCRRPAVVPRLPHQWSLTGACPQSAGELVQEWTAGRNKTNMIAKLIAFVTSKDNSDK